MPVCTCPCEDVPPSAAACYGGWNGRRNQLTESTTLICSGPEKRLFQHPTSACVRPSLDTCSGKGGCFGERQTRGFLLSAAAMPSFRSEAAGKARTSAARCLLLERYPTQYSLKNTVRSPRACRRAERSLESTRQTRLCFEKLTTNVFFETADVKRNML